MKRIFRLNSNRDVNLYELNPAQKTNNFRIKTYRIILLLLVSLIPTAFWSCEDYLEKTQAADISETDVFSTFDKFQGYVETMYDDMVDPIHTGNSYGEFNNGDDILPTRNFGWLTGDYFTVMSDNNTPYYNSGATRCSGTWASNGATRLQAIWQNSWFGIRAANISLAHLNDLVDASDEQKDLIEGQSYFFRAYFHWEMMKAWGNIPFIDTVFTPSDEMRVPQEGLYVTAEKIVKDFQRAAELLPEDWNSTVTGQRTLGQNNTRATKGMAMANMAECLLYCGSPLFNGTETGSYTYNTDYCKRAAAAAWKVIEIANKGVYALEPWATYKNNFFKKNNTFPVTKETIFNGTNRGDGKSFVNGFTFSHIGIGAYYDAPTQNYVELFEMANGLPIEDPSSGHNLMNPWVNRDPRFRYNILIDGDMQVVNLSDARKYVEFWVGGRERNENCSLTGFGFRKYWDETINMFDNGWNQYFLTVPRIRLAEVYLLYAEATNEAYGPTGQDPLANLTAVDAVNIVRARAGMPGVNNKFLGSTGVFRDRIWNERAVELAFESKRWYDLRRWHVHSLPKYKELYELKFDKAHSSFNRVLAKTIQFSEQHYWLPFPTNQITLYPEWKQNPGW